MPAERIADLSISELTEALNNGHNNKHFRIDALKRVADGQLNPEEGGNLMEAVVMGWRRKGRVRKSRLDTTKLFSSSGNQP
ncbi:hypothetical protein A2165_03465 [Candidatus Curtissbacteria bacterium RBG_13_40_7]|uniref:Uncharacterized protein n=1 Tax=Candidatus Curtissbacteria bacterium RBG_13_40_7 TaxID=1797706 RepID=A0A1F5FZ52_9BACT|nr:MAG: hypothetical protein A2165_03465 [Candidatus Curtissbacteria bacterium RBG_13_40_7]